MNEKRTENIKQENKKALLPFILIVMLSTIAGGFVGFFSSRYDENLRDLLLNGGLFLIEAIAPYGMIVADIIFIPAAIIIFIQCRMCGKIPVIIQMIKICIRFQIQEVGFVINLINKLFFPF